MTELAEFALDVACREARRELDALHGAPVGPARRSARELWVVGMGKLGARELNVSSDIDLIYVYDQDGETAGDDDGRGRISNHEYFAQGGQDASTALIGDTTEHGFVFRVDLALRPNGNSGPRGGLARRAGGLFPGAGPRVGALRLAQEPGGRAARLRRKRLGAGAAQRGAAVRVPPLPRLQRVRFAARAAPADSRTRGQAQRRPARARQRRQAVARRHPRDRIHGAAAAGGARRPVPRAAHPARRSQALQRVARGRPDAAGNRRRTGRAPTNSCAGSSTASSTWTTSRRTCCRWAAATTTAT